MILYSVIYCFNFIHHDVKRKKKKNKIAMILLLIFCEHYLYQQLYLQRKMI